MNESEWTPQQVSFAEEKGTGTERAAKRGLDGEGGRERKRGNENKSKKIIKEKKGSPKPRVEGRRRRKI